MGQKTNPTALRLEKTNQHYTGCWYSDRFYLEQLHNNYKINKYISKVFYKVKKVPYFKQRGQLTDRIKPLIYRKVGHQINQVFCLFPRYKKKYFSSWKKGKQKSISYNISSGVDTLSALRSKIAFLYALSAHSNRKINLSLIKAFYPSGYLCKDKLYKDGLRHLSVAKNINKDAPSIHRKHLQVTPLAKALFYKHSRHRQILGPASTVEGPFFHPYTASKGLPKNKNHHQSRLEWVISHSTNLSFFYRQAKHFTLPPQECGHTSLAKPMPAPYFGYNFAERLHDVPVAAPERKRIVPLFSSQDVQNKPIAKKGFVTRLAQLSGNATRQLPWRHVIMHPYNGQQNHLIGHERSHPMVTRPQMVSPHSKLARLYLIKAGFAQQSSSFLAQRVCNGLKNRFTFPRLRRTILWDIKKSKYVKGLRVTISGRLESRSKKAQKARSRTFQWGQTELHVLSSLVQFTRQDLVTPRGKIGVKVWICYGA